jgi:hypothetical protein
LSVSARNAGGGVTSAWNWPGRHDRGMTSAGAGSLE